MTEVEMLRAELARYQATRYQSQQEYGSMLLNLTSVQARCTVLLNALRDVRRTVVERWVLREDDTLLRRLNAALNPDASVP